jgi:ketosteroid isomerase-like protein
MQSGTPSYETIADREAVRDLAARFHDGVNRRDVELLRSLWTTDAVWDLPGIARAEGIDQIAGILVGLVEAWELFVQIPGSAVVDVDSGADLARARVPLHEVGRTIDGTDYRAYGWNEDEWKRTPDGWRLARRTWHPVLVDEAPAPGPS